MYTLNTQWLNVTANFIFNYNLFIVEIMNNYLIHVRICFASLVFNLELSL